MCVFLREVKMMCVCAIVAGKVSVCRPTYVPELPSDYG